MVFKKSFYIACGYRNNIVFRGCANNFWQHCLRIYIFSNSDPLKEFRKKKFPNFSTQMCVPPFQQDQDVRVFSLKIQVLECWQYWKLEKIWFYKKNVKKTQNFDSKS